PGWSRPPPARATENATLRAPLSNICFLARDNYLRVRPGAVKWRERPGGKQNAEQCTHGPHRMGRLRPCRYRVLPALLRHVRSLHHLADRADAGPEQASAL